MNHRREAGKFQVAGVNHHHPAIQLIQPIQMGMQQPPQQSKSVFIEKREVPRKKKFTRE